MKAYIRPRPLRIAYLVEEHEHWQAMLEAIFATSYSHWGGRFALLVPWEKGEIRPAYIPWIEAYDPDIIYSYVNLDEATAQRIHARFGPAYLTAHEFFGEKDRHERAYRPRLPIDPLSVFSVMAFMGWGGTVAAPQPATLVDTHIDTKPSSFLQESFGCYGQSANVWPMGQDMADYLKTLTFVTPETQANTRLVPKAQGEIVGTENALLERLSTQRDLLGLAQMSASLVPRIEVNHGNWSHSVNLMVGDSFMDRVVFWNALGLTPVWLGGSIATLKVSAADVGDVERFNALVNVIRHRVHFPIGGNASFAQITLRSATLPVSGLEATAVRLRAADRLNRYTVETIASIDAPVPPNSEWQRARYVEPGSLLQRPDWHEVKLHENLFRPPAILPRHLRDSPPLPGRAKHGVWQLDLHLQRAVDHSGLQNVQHHWRLPRRLPMERAFVRADRFSSPAQPRSTAGGLLSIAAGMDGNLPEIVLPGDEEAFRQALCGPRFWTASRRSPDQPRRGPVLEIQPSDKGRYLTALLRMSGDIHRAKEIFLSGFWKGRFELLGATPEATDERVARVSTRIRKRVSGRQVASDEDREALARLILDEARQERFPASCLKFDELGNEFDAYRSAYWKERPDEAPGKEWAEYERLSLAASTQYLCQREILHQGYEWRCRQCFNSNWVSVDDLKRQLMCEVCGRNEPAPVDHSWHFKLNGFVLRGLQEHGLLPLVWCLARYAEGTDASFFYLPPHNLFLTQERLDKGQPDAEVDLLMVGDGIVRLVEAKTSRKRIDVAKTVELAKHLRPNVVVLAVMEEPSPGLQKTFADLQEQLKQTDMRAELLALQPADIESSPRLPIGTSFKVRML